MVVVVAGVVAVVERPMLIRLATTRDAVNTTCCLLPIPSIRLQDSLESQLESTRATELAKAVTSLCDMGVRPHTALLERLLAFGPCPEFNLDLMTRLNQALTALLGEGVGISNPQRRRDSTSSSGASSPPSPSSWVAGLDAPPQGADETEFDAFVDAARAHLGATDTTADLAVAEGLQEGAGAAASLQPGGAMWRYMGGGEEEEEVPIQ